MSRPRSGSQHLVRVRVRVMARLGLGLGLVGWARARARVRVRARARVRVHLVQVEHCLAAGSKNGSQPCCSHVHLAGTLAW